MEHEVEISKIIINETVAQQVVVLSEVNGERFFPMVIGMPEILAIDRRIKGSKFPRPLTHDLLANLIKEMGGILTRIVITDLKEHTFMANLVIQKEDKVIHVDCRPSDGLALGAGLDVKIYVDDRVFDNL